MVPMDIDVGQSKGMPANLGTNQSDPGTSLPMSAEAMSVEPMSVDEAIFAIHEVPSWAQPIMSYLADGTLPSEEVSARRTQRRARAYSIINGELYKRSVTVVFQRCVKSSEGQEIL